MSKTEDIALLLKRYKVKLKHLWPEKLPISQDGMNKLINEVIFAEGVPNDPTYHHAIASAVMHLGPITHRKARRFFAKSVRKSIANQAAFEKIQFLREEEKAKELLKQEVTHEIGPIDGPKSQEASSQVVS